MALASEAGATSASKTTAGGASSTPRAAAEALVAAVTDPAPAPCPWVLPLPALASEAGGMSASRTAAGGASSTPRAAVAAWPPQLDDGSEVPARNARAWLRVRARRGIFVTPGVEGCGRPQPGDGRWAVGNGRRRQCGGVRREEKPLSVRGCIGGSGKKGEGMTRPFGYLKKHATQQFSIQNH